MQQIFLDDKPCQLFFSETTSKDSIIEHLIELVMWDESNFFNLKEQHSCYTGPSFMGDLRISGNEYDEGKVLTIVKIEPICL
jgi:hypothetical protein